MYSHFFFFKYYHTFFQLSDASGWCWGMRRHANHQVLWSIYESKSKLRLKCTAVVWVSLLSNNHKNNARNICPGNHSLDAGYSPTGLGAGRAACRGGPADFGAPAGNGARGLCAMLLLPLPLPRFLEAPALLPGAILMPRCWRLWVSTLSLLPGSNIESRKFHLNRLSPLSVFNFTMLLQNNNLLMTVKDPYWFPN